MLGKIEKAGICGCTVCKDLQTTHDDYTNVEDSRTMQHLFKMFDYTGFSCVLMGEGGGSTQISYTSLIERSPMMRTEQIGE